jgi:hypothetical protein
MSALDHQRLDSQQNCRNCYRTGAIPLLLVTALAAALALTYAGKAQAVSASCGHITLAATIASVHHVLRPA